MNRQTFEHLTQTNKKTGYKISKEIKHKENEEFLNWLIENNLSQFVNPKYLKNTLKAGIFSLLFLTSCTKEKETIVCQCAETNDIIVLTGHIEDIDICDTYCK